MKQKLKKTMLILWKLLVWGSIVIGIFLIILFIASAIGNYIAYKELGD
jgi:hypothetical protein